MSENYTSRDSKVPYRGDARNAISPTTDGISCAQTLGAKLPDRNIQAEQHAFESGALSSGHKPPYECLTEALLRRAAMRMQLGMHYGKHNWKKGIRDKAFILDRLNHAVEHLMNALHQIDYEEKMLDDDLAAVVVNCMFAMEYQEKLYTLGTPQQPNSVPKF